MNESDDETVAAANFPSQMPIGSGRYLKPWLDYLESNPPEIQSEQMIEHIFDLLQNRPNLTIEDFWKNLPKTIGLSAAVKMGDHFRDFVEDQQNSPINTSLKNLSEKPLSLSDDYSSNNSINHSPQQNQPRLTQSSNSINNYSHHNHNNNGLINHGDDDDFLSDIYNAIAAGDDDLNNYANALYERQSSQRKIFSDAQLGPGWTLSNSIQNNEHPNSKLQLQEIEDDSVLLNPMFYQDVERDYPRNQPEPKMRRQASNQRNFRPMLPGFDQKTMERIEEYSNDNFTKPRSPSEPWAQSDYYPENYRQTDDGPEDYGFNDANLASELSQLNFGSQPPNAQRFPRERQMQQQYNNSFRGHTIPPPAIQRSLSIPMPTRGRPLRNPVQQRQEYRVNTNPQNQYYSGQRPQPQRGVSSSQLQDSYLSVNGYYGSNQDNSSKPGNPRSRSFDVFDSYVNDRYLNEEFNMHDLETQIRGINKNNQKFGQEQTLKQFSPNSPQPCRYYTRGYCSRGDSCYYSHIDPQISPPSSPDLKLTDSLENKKVEPLSPDTDDSDTNEYTSIDEVVGSIYELAKDHHGSRFLQMLLEEENMQTCETIFGEIESKFCELMTDPFGNYLCQKFLEYCDNKHRLVIIEEVAPSLVEISKNNHGTRAVQKMIEYSKSEDQVVKLKAAMKGKVVELIQDLNANHVIQKCLNHFSTEDKQFVFDEVTAQGQCVKVATHNHGCCVLQRCIDFATDLQKDQLLSEISANALVLVQDPYGNYVVQYVLDLNSPTAENKEKIQKFVVDLIRKLLGHIVELSTQKFSSNVVEKCLSVGGPQARTAIVNEFIKSADNLVHLLQDPFANYVIQTALAVSDPYSRVQLVNAIKPHLALLRNTPYGKRIQTNFESKLWIHKKPHYGIPYPQYPHPQHNTHPQHNPHHPNHPNRGYPDMYNNNSVMY